MSSISYFTTVKRKLDRNILVFPEEKLSVPLAQQSFWSSISSTFIDPNCLDKLVYWCLIANSPMSSFLSLLYFVFM